MKESQPSSTILILLLLVNPVSLSGSIAVTEAIVFSENGYLILNSKAKLKLTDAVIEALDSNISITFDFEVVLRKKSIGGWKRRLFSETFRFDLYKYTLGERYVITQKKNNIQVSFLTLDKALEYLGNRQQIRLLADRKPSSQDVTDIAVRWKLVKSELPIPMALTALLSPDWTLSSRWHVQRVDLQ